MREFLQARILLSLQDHGAFTNWAFCGGPALRFLYDLPRYSEDLDFSITPPGGDARFSTQIADVVTDLRRETYEVQAKIREGKAVASAFVSFPGLLHEFGLSPHRHESLSVKIEIDMRPPDGAQTATRLIRRFVILNLLHHDKASLLAGKIHAILTRRYTKGRDLYDLAWYLSDPHWPAPNLEFLGNALRQTGGAGAWSDRADWRALLSQKLQTADWNKARADVSPFLERAADVQLVSPDVILHLLPPPA